MSAKTESASQRGESDGEVGRLVDCSQADDRRLIQLVRERRLLYARNNMPVASYYNQVKRLWLEVANKMGWSVTDVRRKWSHIRNSYSRHLRNELHGVRTGRGRMVSKWYLADELDFLRQHMATDTCLKYVRCDSARENDPPHAPVAIGDIPGIGGIRGTIRHHKREFTAAHNEPDPPVWRVPFRARLKQLTHHRWGPAGRPSRHSYRPLYTIRHDPVAATHGDPSTPWFALTSSSPTSTLQLPVEMEPQPFCEDSSSPHSFEPDENSAYFHFFRGIHNDYQELPAKKQRLFRRECLAFLHRLLDEEDSRGQQDALDLSNSIETDDEKESKPFIISNIESIVGEPGSPTHERVTETT
uniref:SFRICE_027921 n=1 Tax=Spodoptera frugiperda TaxID=7108 RepID=A0A2H1WPR1_SPOFR